MAPIEICHLMVGLLVFFNFGSPAQKFTKDVTASVFGSKEGLGGTVAAYGDINGDKITDIFVISGSETQNISVFHGDKHNDISLVLAQVLNLRNITGVNSLAPADFNGDGNMDLLLLANSGGNIQITSTSNIPANSKAVPAPPGPDETDSKSPDSKVFVHIIWGSEDGKLSSNVYSSNTALKNQPLLLDANADMIVDLFVAIESESSASFWLGQHMTYENWEFQKCSKIEKMTGIGRKHSHAFVDLTDDGFADLVVTTEKSFDVWQGSESGLNLINSIPFPTGGTIVIGQSAYADIDGDGLIDLLVPICEDVNGKCTKSEIKMYHDSTGSWVTLFEDKGEWNFVQDTSFELLITMVIADYNDDAFLDVLCVMQQDNKEPMAVVLYGSTCSIQACQAVGRSFQFSFEVPGSSGAVLASFYDLESDGTLDILVTVARNQQKKTLAFCNVVSDDVSFLNVKILPGLKNSGTSNLPGSCASYTTTNIAGGSQTSAACQSSQSAYYALQLPYISFGLGRLPNYIDSLTVYVPSSLIGKEICGDVTIAAADFALRQRTWTMLIPNSLLFIKPYLSPDKWTLRMLVTPSKSILATAAVLLGTCILVAIAVIILHCLERKHDLQEKIKDSQRFHFDAM